MERVESLNQIIELFDFENKKFEFEVGDENPTKLLRRQTKNVPNLPGLYFVFSEKQSNDNLKSHLYFSLEGFDVELLYFGKAGGVTSNGKVLRQNLFGRINNVVNGDIPRAKYWNAEMIANNESKFIVYYVLHENPSSIEKVIYNYLDFKSLTYPRLNKKLGRRGTK
jgi:hypothetical protein